MASAASPLAADAQDPSVAPPSPESPPPPTRNRSLSANSVSSSFSVDSDILHSGHDGSGSARGRGSAAELDDSSTLSRHLLQAINNGDRARVAELLDQASAAAVAKVLVNFFVANTDHRYDHEPEILADADALLGPATDSLNLVQVACFLGEEEIALDLVNFMAKGNDVASKVAVTDLLGHAWGGRNTTLHLASFLGMADLVARILALVPALGIEKNNRKYLPVDCTDDVVTQTHFRNAPRINRRQARTYVCSDSALNNSAPVMTTRSRRTDSSASTTSIVRSILASRSTEALNLKLASGKKSVHFDPLAIWFDAAAQGDVLLLTQLVEKHHLTVDTLLPSKNATALHMACAQGELPAVKLLIERSAGINVQDMRGWSPLHYAADGGHVGVVRYLLSLPNIDAHLTTDEDESVADTVDEDEEGGAQLKKEILAYMARHPKPTGDLTEAAVTKRPAPAPTVPSPIATKVDMQPSLLPVKSPPRAGTKLPVPSLERTPVSRGTMADHTLAAVPESPPIAAAPAPVLAPIADVPHSPHQSSSPIVPLSALPESTPVGPVTTSLNVISCTIPKAAAPESVASPSTAGAPLPDLPAAPPTQSPPQTLDTSFLRSLYVANQGQSPVVDRRASMPTRPSSPTTAENSAASPGAHACLLCFDLTRKVTYKNLDNWYRELRQYRPKIPVLILANKVDVQPEMAKRDFKFAVENQLPVMFP
ncbi:hypothetical protein AMAG_18840 [Allomyces macrogynus ATCC 38327]|uniref:protein S-acyltransferase n=1 Tax=Allomyces macrogynus (strain ATCC 38327) TaxID=578462 RepID=A0A0L0SIE0_ALLM3|nr:hypothetical protein AMAG_18840 [Allomyces macrogynus ATCC 38327]|eukprot:KNE62286.1 hypothetical protein AMAG_18840 [Allomyces macrogynus ATCC 38327]